MTDDRGGRAGTSGRPSRADLLRVYGETRTIAVVGASTDPDRPAHYVPAYLQAQGFRVLPVNPRGGELFGERVHRSLVEVDEPIDVVEVFRPPAEGVSIARDAAAMGAHVVWFQPGTHSREATAAARAAGLHVITRLCMGATHGTLGLGPGIEHAESDAGG